MTSMTMRSAGVAALFIAAAALPACAQTVERRVDSAPAGNVTFHFAARSGVCGDGRTYLRAEGDMWYGSFNDMVRAMPCEQGPVRVLMVRDGRELLRIQTFAGPVAADPNATSLGAVPAAEAAAYLLRIASTVDGRPGRDALLPAMLADSTSLTRDLLALARDGQRAREIRRSALSWVVRRRTERGGLPMDELVRTLTTIARDDGENRNVRDQALSSLGQLESSQGLDALVAMTQDASESWLARRAIEVMASGGDPRARQHLRTAAERTELTEEARVAAINGIAGSYATSRDAEFLRGLFRRVNTDRLRDATMNGVASIGGRESRDWILAIARDTSAPIRQRQRAVQLADRLGMTAADLTRMYDAIEDGEVRATIISQLASLGSRAASDKLIAIARTDPMVSHRRRAIQALGRFDDPRVKEFLREMVGR
jgi:HEAT repeat protein